MSYNIVSTDKVFVSFQCGNACTNKIYRIHVSEIIVSGGPICPDCDEECDTIDDVAEIED